MIDFILGIAVTLATDFACERAWGKSLSGLVWAWVSTIGR